MAFTVEITHLDAAARLSQNKAPELQDRVETAFAASDNAAARAVAREMRLESGRRRTHNRCGENEEMRTKTSSPTAT